MCDTRSHNGTVVEKFGEIYMSPTTNMCVLSCLHCSKPFLQVADFILHVQSRHVTNNGIKRQKPSLTKTLDNKASGKSSPTNGTEKHKIPASPERIIIAAKRINLSEVNNEALTVDVEETANDSSKASHNLESDRLQSLVTPEECCSDEVLFDEDGLPFSLIKRLNDGATQQNIPFNNKPIKLTTSYVPPTMLKKNSLDNVRKLLKERFKRNKRKEKAKHCYVCSYCQKSCDTPHWLLTHQRLVHNIQ